jgi:23S rRNA (cytidine1920-2'-O)/16S rRNA (cytidine1409-2'-O)-methyltransferase
MKIRLDKILVSRQMATTRKKAQDMIHAGQIYVNGLPAEKAGSLVASTCNIEIKGEECPYVSRGGYKLAHGLKAFNINPTGFICADIGASTGGFTDCLLQHGARRVYAVDVGYGQLAWKLRQDPRVVVMERTNARLLKPGDISERLDLITIDASFISLTLLITPLLHCFSTPPAILALIKPQFEAGKGKVGKGGVIRDPEIHREIIDHIVEHASSLGLQHTCITESPLLGPKGNREFLIHLTR